MSPNQLNSLFGNELFRRYLQNSLVKDVKVDPLYYLEVEVLDLPFVEICRVLKPIKLFHKVIRVSHAGILSFGQFSALNDVIAKKTFKCFDNFFVFIQWMILANQINQVFPLCFTLQ